MPEGSFYREYGKMALDATLAFVFLVILSPLLCVLWLVVRMSLGKPSLFRQVRPGWRGRPFRLVKFRTMRDAFDADGMPRPDAERLTTAGRILRSTSLDELPELWNVLIGHMSLVGPRPLLMEYLPLYDDRQSRRHEVRPGITGWAQVNGRNALTWEERFELDIWYVENMSVRLDLQILVLTLTALLTRRGISARGHATMPYFAGSTDKHRAK
jgi:lipopolysaccharide/colanic/teichoic acid biosynthesis glycosyltransferase